jgi:hypothetical protein
LEGIDLRNVSEKQIGLEDHKGDVGRGLGEVLAKKDEVHGAGSTDLGEAFAGFAQIPGDSLHGEFLAGRGGYRCLRRNVVPARAFFITGQRYGAIREDVFIRGRNGLAKLGV